MLVEKIQDWLKEKPRQIIAIGDGMTDEWINGVDQSHESGDRFIETHKRVTRPGGVENTANCLSKWEALRVPVFTQPKHKQSKKCRFMEDGEIVWRWDQDTNYSYSGDDLPTLRETLTSDFTVAAVISDYDKGYVTPELLEEVSNTCNVMGIPLVIDCKRELSFYMTGKPVIIKGNWKWWMKQEYDRYRRDTVITNGDLWPMVNGNAKDSHWADGVKCVNHVGAGDCFTAHLGLGLGYGLSLEDAAEFAHQAGRVYVQYPFNRPPNPLEIQLQIERTAKHV